MSVTEFASPAIAYGLGLAIAVALQRQEFARSREKADRYARLPLRYKAICWLVVVPSFTAIPMFLFHLGHAGMAGVVLLLAAPCAYAFAEIKAVSWYRAQGLL